MSTAEELVEHFRERGRVPLWAWTRLAQEQLAAGQLARVRASALNAAAPAEQRVACLVELGAPRDPPLIEAMRELLEYEQPWIVYAALEGLVAAPEPVLDEVVRELLDDERRVCDLWFEDRVSHAAARVVPPPPEWIEARRRELGGREGFCALRILARLGDATALTLLAAEPDDGFGELEGLRKELGRPRNE